MAFDGVSLTEVNNGPAGSAEQDQSARRCTLILLYTLRKSKTTVDRSIENACVAFVNGANDRNEKK